MCEPTACRCVRRAEYTHALHDTWRARTTHMDENDHTPMVRKEHLLIDVHAACVELCVMLQLYNFRNFARQILSGRAARPRRHTRKSLRHFLSAAPVSGQGAPKVLKKMRKHISHVGRRLRPRFGRVWSKLDKVGQSWPSVHHL